MAEKQVNIEDLTPEQSLDTIWSLMNKASSKGVFSIDESYVLKVLFTKVATKLRGDPDLRDTANYVINTPKEEEVPV
tara:strand:+ start:43 stop:273 length:231 start_codon:yes stop_codon:yes gene_type:complete